MFDVDLVQMDYDVNQEVNVYVEVFCDVLQDCLRFVQKNK